jgi:hypothetical protein
MTTNPTTPTQGEQIGVSETKIPAGFRRVTEDEFFAALRSDPRDIMPHNTNPLHTTWETPSRHVWGWTAPGWRNPRAEKIYALQL